MNPVTKSKNETERSGLVLGAYPSAIRRLPFGCVEQRKFELRAEHVLQVADDNSHTVFGNGSNEVMRVVKPSRRSAGGVWFLNAETGNGFGQPFNYGDYFPEFSSDTGANR